MSVARKLLERVAGLGGRVYLADAGNLKVEASAPLPERVVVDLRQHKAEIIAELRRAEVASRLDAMARENEARRDWWTKPVEGWRDGRLTIRSIATGDEITINLSNGRTRN